MDGIGVAGSILADEINVIEKYPKRGELAKITRTEISAGGLVPNVGTDLKRLNPDLPVYAYGKVGKDEKSAFLITSLRQNGLDVSGIKTTEEYGTSFTQVMSEEGGERTFFTYAGASADFGLKDIDIDGIRARIFHLGYFLLLDRIDEGDGEKILKRLKERGIDTSIDLVSSASGGYERVVSCLKYVDYLIINEIEASNLCGTEEKDDLLKLAKRLKDFGVIKKVIIHKADKACIYDGEKYFEQKSLNVPEKEIKGKTGAGDAFCAGCLLEIYNGSGAEKILETGIRTATASLTEASATAGVKTKEEIYESTKRYKRREK